MGWEMMQYKEYAVENRSNKRESSREKIWIAFTYSISLSQIKFIFLMTSGPKIIKNNCLYIMHRRGLKGP